MRLCVLLGFAFQTLDVGGELFAVDPPHTTAADLYGGKVTRANERVGLGGADAQVDRDILIVLMTSALVVAIWGIAKGRLVQLVQSALDTVCGGIGC